MNKKSYFLIDVGDIHYVKTDFVKFYLNTFLSGAGTVFAHKYYIAKKDEEGQFHMYYFKTKKEIRDMFGKCYFAVVAVHHNLLTESELFLEPALRDDFLSDPRLSDMHGVVLSFQSKYLSV